MNFEVNIFTSIVVLIVCLYDIALAINRRNQPQKKSVWAYAILGIIFTIFGIGLLISCLVKRG